MLNTYALNNSSISISRVHKWAFYVLGDDENEKDSHVSITNKEVMKNNKPVKDGVYDSHMGSTDYSWNCTTCGNSKITCPGHFGVIESKFPLKNPLYRDEILKWLKVICWNCGRLTETLKSKQKNTRRLAELCKIIKPNKKCPHCGTIKVNIVKDKDNPLIFYSVVDNGKQKIQKELLNNEIETILQKITPETVHYLGKPLVSHPSKFLINKIRAPPNTVRPDIRRFNGPRSSNSDATSILKIIVDINYKLDNEIPPADQIRPELLDLYHVLDMTHYSMIKENTGNLTLKPAGNTKLMPFTQRINGKQARIRKNVMGKRVTNVIRSVITGDSQLEVDQVGVPIIHAKSLTIPEIVTEKNIDRLTLYYINGEQKYPGCKRIIKKGQKNCSDINIVKKLGYKIQHGDTIMRDLIDGDIINFNRQPSVLFASISTMRIVIMPNGETLRMNPSSCALFNADFDGDNMNAVISENIMARIESSIISSPSRWFISWQNQTPYFGAFQDGLLGLACFTKEDSPTFDKWHAMQIFGGVNNFNVKLSFDKKNYSNRELISMLLPKINLINAKPTFYKKEHVPFINYNPNDTNVIIKRGKLISGILDKKTTGQQQKGSIFHTIANEYGSRVSLNLIFNLQQIIHRYFMYRGFTTGIADILLPDDATKEISRRIQKLIAQSNDITDRLNNGKLIAPLGMSLYEYYEQEQLNALNAGDDLINPIFSSIDFENNGIVQIISYGSKGKFMHILSMVGTVGQATINGKRFLPMAGWGRTSAYFTRHDMNPLANGFIPMAYKDGIDSNVYPFTSAEARDGFISNALGTSVTGYENRKAVKNLENIIVDYIRASSKKGNLVQPLYADCGFNPSKMENVKFYSILCSHVEFEEKFKCDIKNIDKKYQNQATKEVIDNEFNQLTEDRNEFRKTFLNMEDHNPNEFIIEDEYAMPVNVKRIFDDVIYNYSKINDNLSDKDKILDPITAYDSINQLCDKLGYAFYNEFQEKAKMKLPQYIIDSTRMLKILIRSTLCLNNLLKSKISNKLLDIVLVNIMQAFISSLIDYGSTVGVLAAQCISEPMTQFVLDSKHRAGGGGGTKTNKIVRLKEIFSAKTTDKMDRPSMLIMVKPEYQNDKIKVKEIANNLEMNVFDSFVSGYQIFFESYGYPVHPDYKHEKEIIEQINTYNLGKKIPNDLTKWCIRYDIDMEELILKSIKLENITLSIRKKFPNLFVIYTPENSKNLFIRCYIRSDMFKDSKTYYEDNVLPLAEKIRNIVVRGIKGLISTEVVDIIKTIEQPDGSLKREKIYGIETTGTNLAKVLENPYIDPYKTQSNSIEEMERMFGIVCARNKIINEITNTSSNLERWHATIFADEMTYTGMVTNVQRTGLQKRSPNDIALCMSFQATIQTMQDAAINGKVDEINGSSAELMTGGTPKLGTTFSDVYIDEEFIKSHSKSLQSVLDDI